MEMSATIDTLGDTVWSYMLDPNWDGIKRPIVVKTLTFWDGFKDAWNYPFIHLPDVVDIGYLFGTGSVFLLVIIAFIACMVLTSLIAREL